MLDVPTPLVAAPKALAAMLDRRRSSVRSRCTTPSARSAGRRTYGVVARVAGATRFGARTSSRRCCVPSASCCRAGARRTSARRSRCGCRSPASGTLVGVRVSGDDLAQRRYKSAHLPASLKPTVARALVELSRPAPGRRRARPDVRRRYDPARARRCRAQRGSIIGGDIGLRRRWRPRGRTRGRQRMIGAMGRDAAAATGPLRRRRDLQSALRAAARRVRGLDRLYRAATREMARVLRPDGRCVLLTGRAGRAVPRRCRRRCRSVSKRRILLRGLPVTAFVMVGRKRREESATVRPCLQGSWSSTSRPA